MSVYQTREISDAALMVAAERLTDVKKLLEAHGCTCPCDHHPEDHTEECDFWTCLACEISDIVQPEYAKPRRK